MRAVPTIGWSGSWVFAVLSLVAAAIAVRSSEGSIRDQFLERWEVMLLILWLVFGSKLIRWAHARAREFEIQAKRILKQVDTTGDVKDAPIWARQESRLQSRDVFRMLFPFVFVGLIVVTLVGNVPMSWKICWGIAISATFYYGAFGIWGAWVVTRGVADFARDMLHHERMMLYHGDRLAGLGFAVRYSDVASILMLTGVLALPMGIHLGKQCIHMRSMMGTALACAAALLICVWAVFTFISSLRGRAAVAGVIERYRVPLLNELAEQKHELVEAFAPKEQIERLEMRERAALRLRGGLFGGAGGWKDLMSVVASAGALAQFIANWNEALAIASNSSLP